MKVLIKMNCSICNIEVVKYILLEDEEDINTLKVCNKCINDIDINDDDIITFNNNTYYPENIFECDSNSKIIITSGDLRELVGLELEDDESELFDDDSDIEEIIENFNTLTVKELKEKCKEQGIQGYSRLRKQELVDLLNANNEQKCTYCNESVIGDDCPTECTDCGKVYHEHCSKKGSIRYIEHLGEDYCYECMKEGESDYEN